MLKVIAKAISASRAWILSIALLAIIVVVVESSQPFQACVKEIYYNPATENFEKSITSYSAASGIYRDCIGNFTHDNAEAIIAAFTIILALFTIFLWVATRDLVTGAEQTAKRQLRAYVSLKTFGKRAMVDTQTNAVSGWELSLAWQNTGATPTRDMLSHVSVPFEPNEIPDDFRFPDTWIIGRKQVYVPVSLAPNSTFIDGVSPFCIAQLQEVRRGQKTLYLYGWADYNDVFPKTPRHRTEFCARVMLPGDPAFLGEGNITFDIHWKHNGADDECMRKPITSVKRETIPDLPNNTI